MQDFNFELMRTFNLSILIFFVFSIALYAQPQVENPRVHWLKGNYGVMVHWLFPTYKNKDVDKLADNFDVDLFMRDFQATGADWLIFTVGQNSGTYASPNSVIDKYCGEGHCSKRDLALEIARRVKKLGKRFIFYIPCEVRGNYTVRDGFCWVRNMHDPNLEFQKRWLEVLREWSLRFGKDVAGWWVDGAYADVVPHLKWDEWHSALRAGNQHAVITFNGGIIRENCVFLLHPEHDITAGEVNFLANGKILMNRDYDNMRLFLPNQPYLHPTKALWHILFPLDSYWAVYNNWNPPTKVWSSLPPYIPPFDSQKNRKARPPLYSEAELYAFMKHMSDIGGATTINIGIYENGKMADESVALVKKVGERIKAQKQKK